ncbi:AraC family transcriptional regulator [Salimicrobium halophilum]|uniref:AraC-type DNA-binding protein n=1 Tax=Salimicrobium halophilum TaxID=86666 RepID=A0A1G8R7J4_9BACI|nr:AraC family transcriptional regulator [Salimicrobium halophilum]SDJ12947.1 AraC-type DNA-binding protein [Salimicrobium halophilum]
MKESIHLPVTNESFEIYDFSGETNQALIDHWLPLHNDSAERFANSDSLFHLHTHDVMEVFFFLGGSCEFFCEGKTYTLRPGDIVLIPPYAVHQAKVEDSSTYERMILNISPRLLEDFTESDAELKKNIDYRHSQRAYVTRNEESFHEVIQLLKQLIDHIKQGEGHHTFTLHYLLFQSMQMIFAPSTVKLPDMVEKDERLTSILTYIEDHLTDRDLNLASISQAFHLNKHYFSHYFKEAMNLPVYRYILLKRLSNAIALMKKGNLTLEQVAIQSGFSDYSSFYRVFKNVYARSPKKMQMELTK